MKRQEVIEMLEEYGDARSEQRLIQLLKEELMKHLENKHVDSAAQKHELNKVIRELEEDLDWIENEKLAEFDPEQQ
ncbi:MAG: hypothetical protein ABEJ95_07755 [Candidatus Nanohalobium sp.]